MEFQDVKVGDRFRLRPDATAVVYSQAKRAMLPGEIITISQATPQRLGATIPKLDHRGKTNLGFRTQDWFFKSFEKVEAKPPTLHYTDLKIGDKLRLLPGKTLTVQWWVAGVGSDQHHVGQQEILTITSQPNAAAWIVRDQQDHTFVVEQDKLSKFEKIEAPVRKNLEFKDLKPGDRLVLKPGEGAGIDFCGDSSMGDNCPVGNAVVEVVSATQDKLVATSTIPGHEGQEFTVVNRGWLHAFEKIEPETKPLDLKPGDKIRLLRGRKSRLGGVDIKPQDILTILEIRPDHKYAAIATEHEKREGTYSSVVKPEWFHDYEKVYEKDDTMDTTPNMPDRLVVRGQVFEKVDDSTPAKETTEMTGNFTWDNLEVRDVLKVRVGLGRPTPSTDFVDNPGHNVRLGRDDSVRVTGKSETHVTLMVVAGDEEIRGRNFTVKRHTEFSWLTDHFTRLSTADATQEDTTMNKVQTKETTTMYKISTANHKAAAAVKQGLKQAGARMAHRALIAQVKKAFGRKFPRAFFSTPAGKAMLDLGSCYLVMAATEMLPEHPLANRANEVAGLALTAATYDHAVPLIEVATRLIEGAAGIEILGK